MKTTPWEDGDPNSKLLILGEAPAKMEFKMGKPLVGPSGDVFKNCLHMSGLARNECYILNIWPFATKKDRIGNIYNHNSNEMVWHNRHGLTDTGFEDAQKTMERIKASKANVMLTFGQQAFELVSGSKKPITKWRGSILWSDRFQKKYIPTIHPAASLHGTYTWRYLIMWDMQKIAGKERCKGTVHPGEMESPEMNLPQRTYHIAPTYKQVLDYMNECAERKKFCTDLEVINHQVNCFSLAFSKDEALVVPMILEGEVDAWTIEEEMAIWTRYAELMGNPEIMKVNQNIVGFDAPFLFMHCNIFTRGRLLDTMIAQHIMYPDFNKGLDFIASVHTREPYWKDEGKIWKNPNISWHQFQTYCGKDAAVTLEAWDVLSEELTAGGYWPTYNRTVRMAAPLTFMTALGLAIHKEELEATKVVLERNILSKEAELAEISQWPFNPLSSKQCKEYFYETLKIPPYVGRTGSVTTDDTAMSRIVRKDIPGSREAKLVQEIRSLKKLKSTYMDVDLDRDGRLRCSWNPRGTKFGRLSSSETLRETGMNLQNLHPDFKGFIVGG